MEMPYDELVGWQLYFERRPEGWREDGRTMKLLQAQGIKEKAENLFPSLKAVYTDHSPKTVDVIDNAFKGSEMYARLLKAKGGEYVQ